MSLSVAVMGHPARQRFIDDLMPQLPGATLVLDTKNDRHDTGRRALLAGGRAGHHLVVQDDAILCRDFLAGARLVAKAAGVRPVSLYTGNVRPHQHRVAPAVAQARRDGIPWLEMEGPWWGVAIILPTADIPELVQWYDERTGVANYDRRISRWYVSQGIKCLYTVPSLVDHRPVAENPSLVEARSGDRRAHYFIGGGDSPLEIDWLRKPTPKSRRRTLMAQKLILADRRIYGSDAAGRRVLVAAPGQPIPPGFGADEPAPEAPKVVRTPKSRARKASTRKKRA